jgi:TIR domain
MAGKIFISYRRDDDASAAARVSDGLASKFGKANLFIDVDNLLAGQRFDEELTKALAACDMLIAVIGQRWMDLLKAKISSGERDYVREEIAAALQRRIVVVPARVGREGKLPPLPRAEDLPTDIRDLVLHQRQDETYERFGRDIGELIEAITVVRRSKRSEHAAPRGPWGRIGAMAASSVSQGFSNKVVLWIIGIAGIVSLVLTATIGNNPTPPPRAITQPKSTQSQACEEDKSYRDSHYLDCIGIKR